MTLTRKIVAPVFLLFAVCGCSVSAAAQKQKKAPAKTTSSTPTLTADVKASQQRSVLSFDEYEHLLNILFPVDRATPLGLEYTMVLRFESFHHPEEQLTIRRWHDGRIDATLSRVLEGNAWRAAASHPTPDHNPDFAAVAKDVPVRSYKLLVDRRLLDQWHDTMFPTVQKQFSRIKLTDKKIHRSGNTEVTAIGTRYELYFIQPDDELQATAWDTEVAALPTGTTDLTKWMNGVKFYADNHLAGATAAPTYLDPAKMGVTGAMGTTGATGTTGASGSTGK